jgi:hypothetical protein
MSHPTNLAGTTAPDRNWRVRFATLGSRLRLQAYARLHVREGDEFKAAAAILSVLLNVVCLFALFQQDRDSGDVHLLGTESLPVMIAAPNQRPRENAQPLRSAPPPPSERTPTLELGAPTEITAPQVVETDLPTEPLLESESTAVLADLSSTDKAATAAALPPSDSGDVPPQTPQVEIAPAQQAMLVQRVVDAAKALASAQQSAISWQHEGSQYQATLARDPSNDSMDLDNIRVDITATAADGMQRQTQLTMQRLAFSQFTQVVDYWDANVQLHDDEIIGRFHSNSPFAIADDRDATPRFSGKVTTAARGPRFTVGGASRRSKMFEAGLETRTGRIELPDQAQPFALATDPQAFTHTFSQDAHIELAGDGSYTWQARRSDAPVTAHYPQDRPSYFLAAPGVTLYVRGTVNGKVLAYSPERIVIEGNLVYADDPRSTLAANDYLGLVSDRNVEVAPPYVTGRGDLTIHAAIFARRRFVVTSIDYRRTAKLIIYGSLTVGSISATEPRYATRLEFDPRFDRARPPGFPATNRFEVASWNATWSESAPAR